MRGETVLSDKSLIIIIKKYVNNQTIRQLNKKAIIKEYIAMKVVILK